MNSTRIWCGRLCFSFSKFQHASQLTALRTTQIQGDGSKLFFIMTVDFFQYLSKFNAEDITTAARKFQFKKIDFRKLYQSAAGVTDEIKEFSLWKFFDLERDFHGIVVVIW